MESAAVKSEGLVIPVGHPLDKQAGHGLGRICD